MRAPDTSLLPTHCAHGSPGTLDNCFLCWLFTPVLLANFCVPFRDTPEKAVLLPCNVDYLTVEMKKILPRSGKTYPGKYIRGNLLQNNIISLATVVSLHAADPRQLLQDACLGVDLFVLAQLE